MCVCVCVCGERGGGADRGGGVHGGCKLKLQTTVTDTN